MRRIVKKIVAAIMREGCWASPTVLLVGELWGGLSICLDLKSGLLIYIAWLFADYFHLKDPNQRYLKLETRRPLESVRRRV